MKQILKEIKPFFEKGAISAAEFEQIESSYQVAKLNVESAQYAVSSAQASLNESQENLNKNQYLCPSKWHHFKLKCRAWRKSSGNHADGRD